VLEEVAVVIPALDEERSLPLVLAALPRGPRVVVVDNGSSDGTARVAARAGAKVVAEPRRGYGRACLAGLAHLSGSPPAVVAFLDGDYSDDPGELPGLVAPILEDRADLVIGSRVLGRVERGALQPQQRLGNWLACALIHGLYGRRFTDLGPFRALRWDALRRLALSDPDFGWNVEMQVKALRRGLRVVEVPVRYRPRRVGSSKISGTLSGTVRAGYKILYTVLRHAR
jgi:glycosyltransferase involved in cell wall biosynthesis